MLKKVYPSLKKFCLSRIFNKDDALDIAQNCLSILIKKRNQYDPNRDFKAWAMTICRFQIKGYITSKKRCRTDSYSPDSIFFALNNIDSECPFNKEVQRELCLEKTQLINNIKNNRLTKREKIFFELSLAGKSREYIKKTMKITNVNYYQTKSRLINKMRLIINEEV